jgi:hypothetical protein
LPRYTQTIEAQTEWSLGSSVTKVLHGHTLQFGGESRMLLSNFFQPAYPSGSFKFNTSSTAQFGLAPSSSQGNAIASLLAGWANSGSLTITPSVAETSHENALYFKDDWTHGHLTLNIGLRWEHSSPYTDRYNRLQIADFTAPSGVTVPGVGPITGVDQFVTSGQPTSNSEWRNFGPRLGFAYQINPRTVIRGGAGLYYGVNYATSYQDLGPSYLANLTYQPSLNNGLTPYSSLANPFPAGNVTAQGTQYGKLAEWQMIEISYSANRSTHLPDGGTRNRNYISTALRQQYGTSGLAKLLTNPFYSLFTGPNAIFNQPTSVYAQPTIPQVDLLRPYPQFPGDFDGYAEFVANSWCNALQVKYEKRFSRGLNIVASYTLASQNDDSDYTSNSYLGNAPSVQDLNNLRGEYSVGATDATNRLVFSGSYELPFGKGKQFGSNFNSTMNTVFGGWQINAYYTYQTGLPLNVTIKTSRITDGSQRPNVTGDPRSVYSIQQVVNGLGALNYFNVSAFSDPGDQIDGNEPRFNSALRGDSIRDIDASLFKNFTFRERFKLQIRAEFFNFFNTVRFDDPNTSFGNTSFGVISSQANNPRQAQMGARLVF